MTQYLYSLPIIFMTLMCMMFLTAANGYISSAHKKGFFIAFFGTLFIIVCEVLSILLNGSDVGFKAVHFLSNYFGFLLSLILILIFATAIGRFHRSKIAIIGSGAYFVIYNTLIITKQLFYIDEQNNYFRGKLFLVYLIAYFLSIVYLLYETLRYSRKGFLHHKIFAYLLSICFLLSCSIQVINPDVYTTRIAEVLSLCAYYAYDVELANLFDKLTGVLNQGTYLKKIKDLKKHQIVVIFDIDGFKNINDTYGHQFGDKSLKIISRAAKTIFGNYGLCYRIGGDEFAVVLRKNSNVENLITRFEKAITEKFKSEVCQVTVSTGYSVCEENELYENVVLRADSNMYNVKNKKKAINVEDK